MRSVQHLLGRWALRRITLPLYRAARLRRRLGARSRKLCLRRAVHVSPAYFSSCSVVGGGERYAHSLAGAMAELIEETVLVSFGETRRSYREGRLQVEIYPVVGWINGISFDPYCLGFLREVINADVVHCHQYRTFVTTISILVSTIFGKPVFVTDEGGWASNVADELPLADFVNGFLAISKFSANTLPIQSNGRIIYGGVGRQFADAGVVDARERKILFVGRILPHKGINYLIEAIDNDLQLDIIGRVYDKDYFSLLQELSRNKNVRFLTGASDSEIIEAYGSARVTVLPSVYRDINGVHYPASELLGLVLLESMACGTPVICTDVGGMPEIVENGRTGFVVPPNDPRALRERIHWLLDHPEQARHIGETGRQRVLAQFTWPIVAAQCLRAYADFAK